MPSSSTLSNARSTPLIKLISSDKPSPSLSYLLTVKLTFEPCLNVLDYFQLSSSPSKKVVPFHQGEFFEREIGNDKQAESSGRGMVSVFVGARRLFEANKVTELE